MTLKKSLFAALVAVSALALLSGTASAHLFGRGSCGSWGGGSWGGGWGSRGSWGSGGSWGGGSCGSYGGSYGSGGSWGGYSSCGSCGGGYTVISSSCGSCGGYSSYSYGGYDGGYARVSSPVTTIVASSTPAVKTRLTLHVPADAKVTLAGVETKQTGEVRQFATSKLSSGQNWSDYKVVVETTRDGKVEREERTITLTGGQDQDLAVNFTNDSNQQVAQQ